MFLNVACNYLLIAVFTLQFSSNWYYLFGTFLLGWCIITLLRKKQFDLKEAKQQILLGALGTSSLVSMELFAVSTNLWNYYPANWPVILWPTYFAAILFGYQLLRTVERVI